MGGTASQQRRADEGSSLLFAKSSVNNNSAKSVLEMGPQEIMALQMAQLARVRKVNAESAGNQGGSLS